MVHTHQFLVVGDRAKLRYAPLSYRVQIQKDGRTFTGLQLNPSGGVVPDPRTRRPKRLGPHGSLQPGLRISDLVGRVQATLAPLPQGGLKVVSRKLKNPLLGQWLRTGVGLATFLHPRPKEPTARSFEDRRLPPTGLVRGVKQLLRRFRRVKPVGPELTYRVDAPLFLRRRAKSGVVVSGQVSVVAGEPLPRRAELTLEGVQPQGKPKQTVVMTHEALGQRCNRK